MLIDLKVDDFVKQTAAASPVPGGGSVSALAGALAAALSAMVASLSMGKKGDDAGDTEMERLLSRAGALQQVLTKAVDRDVMAYDTFLTALKLPKRTPAEKDSRQREMQAAIRKISEVPLAVAESALEVLHLAAATAEKGRKDIVTDAAVAVLLSRAAVRGALYNLKFNLRSLKDDAYVQESLRQAAEMEKAAEEKEKSVLAVIGL